MTDVLDSADRKAYRLFLEGEQYEDAGKLKKAFVCFLSAARLGHVMSQVNLGNFYSSGRGIERSLERAAHWYKKAYHHGDRDGALNLAIDRRNGGNIRSAEAWFKKAVSLNSGSACIALARIYCDRAGLRAEAITLLRRALAMSRDDISKDEKHEARILLKEMEQL